MTGLPVPSRTEPLGLCIVPEGHLQVKPVLCERPAPPPLEKEGFASWGVPHPASWVVTCTQVFGHSDLVEGHIQVAPA